MAAAATIKAPIPYRRTHQTTKTPAAAAAKPAVRSSAAGSVCACAINRFIASGIRA